jgi:hypothetical protein
MTENKKEKSFNMRDYKFFSYSEVYEIINRILGDLGCERITKEFIESYFVYDWTCDIETTQWDKRKKLRGIQ